MKTDEQLLVDYVKGDTQAFSILYNKHKGGVYRYILRQIKHKETCDDLFQEVWQKVVVNSVNFQPRAKFTTWLYTLARNRVIDEVRHVKIVSQTIDSDDEEADAHPDASSSGGTVELERQRNKQKLLNCLNKLPSNLLDAFILKEESGLTGAQIAEVVNIGVEATKSRLRTAYAQLKQCMQSNNESSRSAL